MTYALRPGQKSKAAKEKAEKDAIEAAKPKRGRGRPEGSMNARSHVTVLHSAIMSSFERVGGPVWLEKLANSDPKCYAKLLGILMSQTELLEDGTQAPLQIRVQLVRPKVSEPDSDLD